MIKNKTLQKIIRLLLDCFIIALTLLFLLSLLWFLSGSLEMVPTEEQQNKARLGAVLLMLLFGAGNIACIAARIKRSMKRD